MASSGRQSALAIDLGGEQILLERVEAVEALGRPFVITVDLFSALGELDVMPHLGKPATVTVLEDGELQRYFHGIVVESEYLSEQTEGFHYRLVLRPWTFLLSQNVDFAIFQEKTAIEIIQEVLGRSAFVKIDASKAGGPFRKRDYTVQYGESDFTFISRLLEEEGVYYYFEHGQAEHKMILCDAPSDHAPGKPATLEYNPYTATVGNADSAVRSDVAQSFYLQRWHERVVTGGEAKVTLRDWDFTKPGQPLEATHSETKDHSLDAIEVYEWPGNFPDAANGARASTILLESRRGGRQSYSSETQNASLQTGKTFTLTKHPNDRFNADYLVTRTHHIIASEIYRSGGGASGHIVHFEAIPAKTKWRSPIVTPKPVVRGPETAIVTGPQNETIFTDEYARVKVRFHWDRGKTAGDKSTCWIRVSQTGGLGNLILPRVGHEVVVDFLDGDPDRPIVMGRVFNQAHRPIYPLPANKTRMLWRSDTYKESGSYGAAEPLDTGAPRANEIRFEDNGGKEEFFVHAERDMTRRTRHKESHHVGLDLDEQFGGSRSTKIKHTDTLDVKESIKIDAGTTIDITAKTSITLTVGKSKIVMKPESIAIEAIQFKTAATAMAELKSPLTTVKGDGMLTLKGGMTMINC